MLRCTILQFKRTVQGIKEQVGEGAMNRWGTQAKWDHDMETEGKITYQLRQQALTICKIQRRPRCRGSACRKVVGIVQQGTRSREAGACAKEGQPQGARGPRHESTRAR